MKIGILTFHRAHNYGAVLQCYALQEVLKSLGHDVEVIDYRQNWTENVYRPFSFKVLFTNYPGFISKLRYIWGIKYRLYPFKQAKKNYSAFRAKYLSISKKYKQSTVLQYDACVVGSDQLWGINCLGNKPDTVYLGNVNVKQGCKKIAYAISSNVKSIDYLQEQSILNKSLSNFDYASFREQVVINRIEQFTHHIYPQCIDPTLLTTESIWKPLLNNKWKEYNYIVCYRARGNGKSGFSLEKTAENLALKLHCSVVDLTPNQYSVEDFVSAIANAQYVVTTSFHATVFALIFKVPLASYLLHDGHDSRYEDLLNSIGGTQFIYETCQAPRYGDYIDWDKLHSVLNNYKKVSIEFLLKSIG